MKTRQELRIIRQVGPLGIKFALRSIFFLGLCLSAAFTAVALPRVTALEQVHLQPEVASILRARLNLPTQFGKVPMRPIGEGSFNKFYDWGIDTGLGLRVPQKFESRMAVGELLNIWSFGGQKAARVNSDVAHVFDALKANYDIGNSIGIKYPKVRGIGVDLWENISGLIVDKFEGDGLKSLIANGRLEVAHLRGFDEFIGRVMDAGYLPLDAHPGNFFFGNAGEVLAFDVEFAKVDVKPSNWLYHTTATRQYMAATLIKQGKLKTGDAALHSPHIRKLRKLQSQSLRRSGVQSAVEWFFKPKKLIR